MPWRRTAITVIATLTALVGLTGATTLAYAAPQVSYGPPKEGAKVVLAETSIDGPAIMTTYSPATVIAWAGTDQNHRLNLMTSSDGLHYANKVTLPDYSPWRPAIAFIDSGRGAPYGTIALAWTGSDKSHTLNLEFIKMPGYVVTQKITFWGETSFTAPALTTVNGDVNSDIYLSWTGTDAAHTLNVIHRTTNPVTQSKKILWGWSTISRPNLATDLSSGTTSPLLLSWTGTNNRICFATSADGSKWTEPSSSPLAAMSAWAPSTIGFYTTTQPNHWLTWTGSGPTSTHRIAVMYTQHFPSWSDSNAQSTLAELAISSPELTAEPGFNGAASSVLLAWTGTDSAHHLNVAQVTV
jgi:hypothetical protein